MLSKIFKTAKFVSGWCSWSLLYPLVATDAGRLRLARMTVTISKMYPDKVQALRDEVDQLMTLLVTGPGGMAPPAPEPEIVVEDATVVEEPATKPSPFPGTRTLIDLKARLGLKKS